MIEFKGSGHIPKEIAGRQLGLYRRLAGGSLESRARESQRLSERRRIEDRRRRIRRSERARDATKGLALALCVLGLLILLKLAIG